MIWAKMGVEWWRSYHQKTSMQLQKQYYAVTLLKLLTQKKQAPAVLVNQQCQELRLIAFLQSNWINRQYIEILLKLRPYPIIVYASAEIEIILVDILMIVKMAAYLSIQTLIIDLKLMKSKMGPLRLCSLLLAISLCSCSFGVYNLQALGESNSGLLAINYSIANFGFVPYGKTIIGRLMSSPNFSSECGVVEGNDHNYENSFMLIPRGECEFVTKVLNAQRLGAQMAVVMDDKFHENVVIMADNNYGYKVKIPAIFINHADGQQLRELLEDHPDSSVMMKIAFENRKTEKVGVKFWLQANNRHSYRLVEDFRKFYPLVESQLNFQLIYSSIPCEKCREQDCYFGKAYCALNVIHGDGATGRLILDQQIREQIVFRLYPQKWWMYMKKFDEECAPIAELKDCGSKVMKAQGIDPLEVQKAFTNSFSKDGDNSYLHQSNQTLKNSGINRFPMVTLNEIKVKGSLNAEFIFDDICNTLINPPAACQKYITTSQSLEEVTNAWSTLLLIVVLGIVIFSIIFVVYRRHMKRRISTEMQSRVDDMVSKYIEFYSDRSKK